jgi:hypothetical protein
MTTSLLLSPFIFFFLLEAKMGGNNKFVVITFFFFCWCYCKEGNCSCRYFFQVFCYKEHNGLLNLFFFLFNLLSFFLFLFFFLLFSNPFVTNNC